MTVLCTPQALSAVVDPRGISSVNCTYRPASARTMFTSGRVCLSGAKLIGRSSFHLPVFINIAFPDIAMQSTDMDQFSLVSLSVEGEDHFVLRIEQTGSTLTVEGHLGKIADQLDSAASIKRLEVG